MTPDSTRFALALLVASLPALAGPRTWDIATFDAPEWKVESGRDEVAFTFIDNASKTFCQVGVYNSQPGTGDAQRDFTAEWAQLVAPKRPESTPAPVAGTTSGGLPYLEAGAKCGNYYFAQLTFRSGARRMSVVLSSSTEAQLTACRAKLAGFFSSLRLAGGTAPAAPPAKPPPSAGGSLVGTWTTANTAGSIVDAVTGAFETYASGDALSFELAPNGTAKVYGIMESTMGVCTMRVFMVRDAQWLVSGDALQFEFIGGSGHTWSSCGAPKVKPSKPVLTPQRYRFRVLTESGVEVLEIAGEGVNRKLRRER